MGCIRSQTSMEYLLLVSLSVVLVLIASLAFFTLTNGMVGEYNTLLGFEKNLVEVITD